MSTLQEIRTKVANEVRDPLLSTFTSSQIDQLVNNGIIEINVVWPKEYYEELAGSDVDNLVSSGTLPTARVTSLFRVEWFRDGTYRALIPENQADESQGGWEFFADILALPSGIANAVDSSTDTIRLWGYTDRALLANDADVADLNDAQEWGVRAYAKWQAFVLMSHERALFTQWQAQSQNKDISPTQLAQMVGLYASEWQDIRKHLRRQRR